VFAHLIEPNANTRCKIQRPHVRLVHWDLDNQAASSDNVTRCLHAYPNSAVQLHTTIAVYPCTRHGDCAPAQATPGDTMVHCSVVTVHVGGSQRNPPLLASHVFLLQTRGHRLHARRLSYMQCKPEHQPSKRWTRVAWSSTKHS
jgi:hypothetical protein